jgi:hypothetical protein
LTGQRDVAGDGRGVRAVVEGERHRQPDHEHDDGS